MRQALCLVMLALSLQATAELPRDTLPVRLQAAQRLVSLNHLVEALQQFQAILVLEPDCGQALFGAGWIYNQQRKYDRAIATLARGCQLSPSQSSMHSELAYAHYKLGNIEGALQAYSQACQLEPTNARLWVSLGDVNFELKKDSQAASVAYRKAVELGSLDGSVFYRLGWCCNDLGQFEEALAPLRRASQLHPKAAAVWLELGYSLLRCGRSQESVQALVQANVLEPKLRLGHLYLGRAYLQLGQSAQAREQVEALKSIDIESARQLEVEITRSPDRSPDL